MRNIFDKNQMFSMWYDSIVSLQGAEISVYERDVGKQVVEGDGRQVQKIKIDDNPADMLTKVVTTIKFNHCLDFINIANV